MKILVDTHILLWLHADTAKVIYIIEKTLLCNIYYKKTKGDFYESKYKRNC